MKNILLLVHDDIGMEARFQAALDLARGLDGHLICADITWTPPIISNGIYDDAYAIAELATQEAAREAALRGRLEARLTHEDVPWNWLALEGDFGACLERAATLADLLVVSRDLGHHAVPDMLRTASEVIVRSTRPVMAVPPECQRLGLESALIAWNGSAAAAAALHCARPLLRLASRVTLLEIEAGTVPLPAEEAAQYLSGHGTRPLVRRIKQSDGGLAHTLLGVLAGGDYDYVVMGGFGHARWREAVFGGLTRAMLKRSPIPVFYAH